MKSKIPFDFNLVPHTDERSCAERHLAVLEKDDVVVYDRGYFSYNMLHQHDKSEIHAFFRLQESTYSVIRDFFSSQQTDIIASIDPSSATRHEIMRKHPELGIVPLKMRLIKYQLGDNPCRSKPIQQHKG